MSNTDFNPEDEARSLGDEEQTRGPSNFRGKDLWEFSDAAEMIYGLTRSESDTTIYAAFSLVYLLTKRTEATFMADFQRHIGFSKVRESIDTYVADVLTWVDSLKITPQDKAEAMAILKKELNLLVTMEVVATPPKRPGQSKVGGILKKKAGATPQGAPGARSSRRKR